MSHYVAYSDGSYCGNNASAFAVLIINAHTNEEVLFSAGIIPAKDSRKAELHAIQVAVKNIPNGSNVTFFTDQKNFVDLIMSDKCHKKDYTKKIKTLCGNKQLNYDFQYAKAHCPEFPNLIKVDHLARKTCKRHDRREKAKVS